MDIVKEIQEGNIRAIARLITMAERHEPEAVEAISEIYSRCGNAHLIGITGPPGVGKSCLVSVLVQRFRQKDMSVGVLAVDPSSPLSSGAFLGDRARMMELNNDQEVYIRSLASRGFSGGLSAAVNDAADILDVAGKDVILIETVGVGQGEIDIARLAHTVLLVLMPGYGDTLQALKAGIIEVADILVVNKADKLGADQTVAELASVQHFQSSCEDEDKWVAPITKTCALTGEGIDDLALTVLNHFQFLKTQKKLKEKNRERRIRQFLDILTQQIRQEFLNKLETDPVLQGWVKKISDFELDPYSASLQVISLLKELRDKKIHTDNS